MKQLERIAYGSHGQGALVKFDDGPNWISYFNVHGKEHRQSTGTSNFKQARKKHKENLDMLRDM